MRKLIPIVFIVLAFTAWVAGCKKNDNAVTRPKLQIYLTDKPDPNVKEVWVDIRGIEIKMSDDATHTLSNVHTGVYNLLELTNGKDTLLADAEIPAGTISQIRLILGDDNYIITKDGAKIALSTPSAQQSGLKVQVKQTVTGGVLYRLKLDFDAGQSIVKAGNSGNYILKPVLRILSFVPSGGIVKGVVVPDSVLTFVYAIVAPDTLASTATNAFGQYTLRDIAAGNYSLVFSPADTIHKEATRTVSVQLGQTVLVDTVRLERR